MENEHLIGSLIRKRAELAGEAVSLRERLNEIDANIHHLDATIGLIDPSFDLETIGVRRFTLFSQGSHARIRYVLDVWRTSSQPLVTSEVVRQVMVAQGLEPRDKEALRLATKRIVQTLNRQRSRDVIKSGMGEGKMVVWSLP